MGVKLKFGMKIKVHDQQVRNDPLPRSAPKSRSSSQDGLVQHENQ